MALLFNKWKHWFTCYFQLQLQVKLGNFCFPRTLLVILTQQLNARHMQHLRPSMHETHCHGVFPNPRICMLSLPVILFPFSYPTPPCPLSFSFTHSLITSSRPSPFSFQPHHSLFMPCWHGSGVWPMWEFSEWKLKQSKVSLRWVRYCCITPKGRTQQYVPWIINVAS